MLGVRSVSGLAFYDWDSTELVRRIEITPKQVRRTTTTITECKLCRIQGTVFH